MRSFTLGVLCLGLSVASSTWAQSCLPTATVTSNTGSQQTSKDTTLGCVVRNLYGVNGLVLPNPNHSAHFTNESQANLTPLNAALGTQLTLLPLVSPASGYTFTLDPATNVYTRSSQSFGPILGERAETIGRGKVFFGFTFQHYSFDKIDNFDVHNFPVVFGHGPFGGPGFDFEFEKDAITSNNNIDLKINQSTIFATVGITNRLDVSVAIPIVNASVTATSTASIFRVAAADVNGVGADPTTGQFHYFDQANPNGSTTKTFVNSSSASGIGDVIIRAKGTLWKNDKTGVALGMDFRMPTGDERNFLGSGAAGFKPFFVASTRWGKASPHLNIGYQWNGDSVLAGDIDKNTKASLPDQFFWTLGADVGVHSRVTLAFDVLGQRTMDAPRLVQGTFTTPAGALKPATTFTEIVKATESFDIINGSAGVKVNLGKNLLATFNGLFRMNNGGLRDNFSPLFGLSYTF